MYSVLPYGNSIDRITIKGIFLRKTLEISAGKFSPDGKTEGGGFPQVSGLKVIMDLRKPTGSRITKLKALCVKCEIPIYEDLKDDEVYSVALISHLANGGGTLGLDGDNHLFNNEKIEHFSGPLDIDVFQNYLKLRNPVIQGIEDRIILIKSSASDNFGNCNSAINNANYLLLESFYLLLAQMIFMLTF